MRAVLAALLWAGCGAGADDDDGAPAPCDDAPVTTWDNFAEGFLREACQGCHAAAAPDRHDAPAEVTFDTEEDALRWADEILATAASDTPTMPPRGGVEPDDRYRLGVWLRCGG